MDLLVAELVCYILEIHEVVHVFQTCQDLRLLSKKSSLWSYLMRRDFPEHYQLCQSCDVKEIYMDLHQNGAFFKASRFVSLWPQKPVMIASVFPLVDVNIVTIRRRIPGRYDLRLPGRNFVTILKKTHLSPGRIKKLETLDPQEVIRHEIGTVETVMLQSSGTVECFELKQIKEWNGSNFDKIIDWILDHFETEYIEAYGINPTTSIEFIGKLRQHAYVGFYNMDDHTRDRCVSWSTLMRAETGTFHVKDGGDADGDIVSGRLYSLTLDMEFYTMNEEEIPTF